MRILRLIVHSLLAIVLISTTGGVPVVLHYCSGQVKSVQVFAITASCNNEDCDDTSDNDGCCHDNLIINQFTFDATSLPAQEIEHSVCIGILSHCYDVTQYLTITSFQSTSLQVAINHPQRRQSLLCIYRV